MFFFLSGFPVQSQAEPFHCFFIKINLAEVSIAISLSEQKTIFIYILARNFNIKGS